MKIPYSISLLAALTSLLFAAGCSEPRDHGKISNHADHNHTAPHGGTLIKLGHHAYNVELLRDNAAGKLTAWVLDAHAEDFIRIAAPTIELVAVHEQQSTLLVLQAVAYPATGEKVGDTSQFEVQADWLKTAGEFSGTITLEIKGTKFEKVPYRLAK